VQLVAESAYPFLLVRTVQVAELFVSNDLGAGEAGLQLLFEYGEQDVAPEEVVPKKCHSGTLEGLETVGLATRLDASGGAWPHDGIRWFHHAIMHLKSWQAHIQWPVQRRNAALLGGEEPLVVVPCVHVERRLIVDLHVHSFKTTGFQELPHRLVAV